MLNFGFLFQKDI